MDQPEDAEVMMQVRGGDAEGLAILFDRHHRSLYAYCLRLTGRAEVAEDVVQEVFCRILRYRESFRPGQPFAPWVYRMARNACIDHLRAGAREGAAPEEWDRASDEPLPEERAGRREEARLLERALRRLPEDKRDLILLARYGGLDYREVAATLGCTVGAVKVRMHRSLKQLREIYREMAGEAAT